MSDFGDNDEYLPSDSEDEYTKEEKILLQKAKSRYKKDFDNEDGVFDLPLSDSDQEPGEDEDENEDIDMDSDLDREEDNLPDDKAWGKKKRSFYNTDYVDPDYGGTFQGQDAESAEQEEEEARKIQKRLVEQLLDSDFAITDLIPKDIEVTKKEVIETDLTKLSQRQKLDLLQKESPEFLTLVNDFTAKLTEVKEQLLPILELVDEGKITSSHATDYANTKFHLILNYCTNICFYVMLKAKRTPVKDHPVIQSLLRYRQLLQQLETVDDKIKPQINDIIGKLNKGEDVTVQNVKSLKPSAVDPGSKSKKIKKTLSILKQLENRHDNVKMKDVLIKQAVEEDSSSEDESIAEEEDSLDEEQDSAVNSQLNEDEKRAITYEMAKNKGLTPRRKKELRNPRVKHRNKFRKAIIRRRGQVRTARSEIPNYGGEPTGIKAYISKSIKFKY